MNKFLSFLISLNSIILFAQKEHNIWYFNNGAGIDFNQNPPSLLTNGALTIGEPSTSICDINGQLLFYSNGLDIYNRQHQVMPNGAQLNGNLSSTQGALIVQKPNSTDEYFLFTNGAATWGPNGWQYNHVDMTLDNGLGDVVTKNQLISPSVTEKLCATHHSNGLDIWVLAHDSATNNFQRVLVTNAGVSPVTAVPIGSTPPFNVDNIGQMKFSASGDRIALNYQVSNVLELFDFDKTNGAITNHISLNLPINASESNYGLEFSTNGQYLYVGITNIGASVQGRIIQYDVSLLTATDILASAIEVGSFNCFMGSFQIAPDGKIYIAEYRSTGYGNPLNKIGVVNSPNSPGLNCNYSPQSFDLIGINSGPTLPNQVASYFFQAEILSDLYCLGDSTTFDLTYNTIPDSVEWDFGDPASIANNSILMNPKHLYSAPGVYNVQLISYLGAIVDTSFQTITISSMPLDLGNDTTLCGDSLILNGPNNWLSYQWSTGSDSSSAVVDSTGMYFLTVSNSGCNASDSIHVTLNHLDLDLPIDTTFCSDSILIVANTTAGTFVWNTGSTQNQIWVSQPGTYTVTVTSGGCSQSDSVNVIMSQQNLDLGNDTIICGTSFTIDAGNFDTYIWSNGASSSSINVSSTGVYFVTATDNQGCSYMDSLDVIIDTLELDIGLDTTICFGDSIVLKDYYLGLNSNYLWSTGSIEDSIIIYSPGHYWLQSANSACKIIDSINVIVMDESIDLGEDRMSCEGEKVTLNNNLNTLVQWNDSIFAFSLEVESGVYWANYVNAAGCMSADTVIIERQKNIFSVLSDTALCLKDGYLVTLDDQIEAPVWQDGSVGEYYLVNAPGEYSFIGEMAGCPVSDTIFITEKGCELIVPNAFSPNNDGLNDFFSIYGEIAGLEGLFIYNRWGDLIFETNDTNHAWDGTHSGEQCQEGVYVVKIAYQTLSNDFEEYYGHLTLLR